ncbi:MAG: hypothetical protein KBE09_01030 [Candidatus Pacebacteria bacterium]|nr:hypothetical protein [Candidatus Paceibacterota bacterium]
MNTKIIVGIVVLLIAGGAYFVMSKEKAAPVADTAPVPVEVPMKTANEKMSFFITSKNPGQGGNLGGLAGADAYCQSLAESAGVTGKSWAAYLSTTDTDPAKNVHAKDRIGSGPWYNFNGELIASTSETLHGENFLNKATALDEQGNQVKGRGDEPNDHDILTGSDAFGMAVSTSTSTTCDNWTAATSSSAIVGHHDRIGINESAPMKSWVSSHQTRGCSLEQFRSTGGAGLFYCFAK